MAHVLSVKDGRNVAVFGIRDILDIVGDWLAMISSIIWKNTMRISGRWKQNLNLRTRSMKKNWSGRGSTSGPC